jgi:hypothetical protein
MFSGPRGSESQDYLTSLQFHQTFFFVADAWVK